MNNDPVRVLHMIAVLEMGGSQSMIMNIYRSIDRQKVQFDFIVDHPDKSKDLRNEIDALGGKVFYLPTFKGKNLRDVCRAWNQFFVEHTEYKILHTHSRSYASLYLPIAKKHKLITIAHSHSTSNGIGILSRIKDFLQLPLRYQADYMFACSEEAGKWLFGKNCTNKKNFKEIPNAINSKLFVYNSIKREIIRKELGLDDAFVIGHVGRFTEPKNHRFLLKIFSEYHKKNLNSKLLLLGNGELKKEIKEQAKELGILNDVIFLGERINTYDYYQAMDCFIFPSLWEGLGIAIIEAEAAGLPCLVSENIPRKVDVGAGLLKFISLNDSPSIWLKEIPNSIERKDISLYVKNAGFDIEENAYFLQTFYDKIVNE